MPTRMQMLNDDPSLDISLDQVEELTCAQCYQQILFDLVQGIFQGRETLATKMGFSGDMTFGEQVRKLLEREINALRHTPFDINHRNMPQACKLARVAIEEMSGSEYDKAVAYFKFKAAIYAVAENK